MGSVSSVNPGVANLLQSLTNLNSPIVSSPAAVTALENAPASDIVQLSTEAQELASVDALFGISTTSSASQNLTSVLESIASGQAGSTSSL